MEKQDLLRKNIALQHVFLSCLFFFEPIFFVFFTQGLFSAFDFSIGVITKSFHGNFCQVCNVIKYANDMKYEELVFAVKTFLGSLAC